MASIRWAGSPSNRNLGNRLHSICPNPVMSRRRSDSSCGQLSKHLRPEYPEYHRQPNETCRRSGNCKDEWGSATSQSRISRFSNTTTASGYVVRSAPHSTRVVRRGNVLLRRPQNLDMGVAEIGIPTCKVRLRKAGRGLAFSQRRSKYAGGDLFPACPGRLSNTIRFEIDGSPRSRWRHIWGFCWGFCWGRIYNALVAGGIDVSASFMKKDDIGPRRVLKYRQMRRKLRGQGWIMKRCSEGRRRWRLINGNVR
jgi:hypothetical protein